MCKASLNIAGGRIICHICNRWMIILGFFWTFNFSLRCKVPPYDSNVCNKSKAEWSEISPLLPPSFFRMTCKEFLCEKAKQTGRPRHKESATQKHVAAKPTQSPPLPKPPFNSGHHTLPLFHTYTGLSQKKERWRRRRAVGEVNSDFYSVNVTTSQRGPHDTATKSE